VPPTHTSFDEAETLAGGCYRKVEKTPTLFAINDG
jgi:hypothetical protein